MEYSLRDVAEFGMRLAEGDGIISNVDGAYLFLDYAKDDLKPEERETYQLVKQAVGASFEQTRVDRNKILMQALQPKGIVNQANVKTVKLKNPVKEINEEMQELLALVEKSGKEEDKNKCYGDIYSIIKGMIKNYREGHGVSGNSNREKRPENVKFGNLLSCIFNRFTIQNSSFATRMGKYIKDNEIDISFNKENLKAMIVNYIGGTNAPSKEVLEIIVGTLNQMNTFRIENLHLEPIFPLERPLTAADFKLSVPKFFKTVFVINMTDEEKASFANNLLE